MRTFLFFFQRFNARDVTKCYFNGSRTVCETMKKNCFFLLEMKENSSVNNKNASLIKQFVFFPPFSCEISYIWLGIKQIHVCQVIQACCWEPFSFLFCGLSLILNISWPQYGIMIKKKTKKTILVFHQPELSYHVRNKRRAFLTPCSSAALLSSGLCWRHTLLVREMMMRIKAMWLVHVNKHTHCRYSWYENGSD